MQYIYLSGIFHVVKVVVIVTSVHLNVLTLFVVCHFLNPRVFPEWRLNPGLIPEKVSLSPELDELRCPFNRGNRTMCTKGEVPQ